ncbi:MAG: hypothetical protein AAF806_31660, partial [Bacteroidota bacterium]
FLIKKEDAVKIYDKAFYDAFHIKKDSNFYKYQNLVVYTRNKSYYIGYATVLDKRGNRNPHLAYVMNISANTGELVKKIKYEKPN